MRIKIKMDEKTILCFGDSNTWGCEPLTGVRYGPDVRWPRRLEAGLTAGFRVVEEGLSGRTAIYDDPIYGAKSARPYLPVCLESHAPICLVVLTLGTNDLRARFGLSAYDIAAGIQALGELVLASSTGFDGGAPGLLIMSPPPAGPFTHLADLMVGAEKKSVDFRRYYKQVAETLGCGFFDAGKVVTSSKADGLHWEKEAHIRLGDALVDPVLSLCGQRGNSCRDRGRREG